LERIRDATDTLAWEEFFGRYWRLVFALAKARGCSDQTAEEIVQDVMLKVFDEREVFRYDPGRGRFRDWLGAVVRNRVAQVRRRPSEQARALALPWDDNIADPSHDVRPDEVCEAAFEQALLATLLRIVRREVHPRTYQAFELFVLKEIPGADVARTTGLSRNAVYQARKNVLRRLTELGAAYRTHEVSDEDLRAAVRAQPDRAVERAIVTRTQAARSNRLVAIGRSCRE